MSDNSVHYGTIKKVVHVRFAHGGPADFTGSHGYGIIQDARGQDVYFVDTAVQDAAFSSLKSGRAARFTLEQGPLRRAAKIWVAPLQTAQGKSATRTRTSDRLGASQLNRLASVTAVIGPLGDSPSSC